jgi:vancomycin resistance protein YoaR
MKQLSFRIHPLLVAVLATGALFVALFALYGINRWVSSEEVIGRVQVAEADLGGRNADEALDAISALEIDRITRLLHFTIDGNSVDLQPGETGLAIDEDALVAEAMRVGREGNFATQFLHWLTHIFSTTDVPLVGTVNGEAMEELFDMWDVEVIAKPIDLGSVEVDATNMLVAHYPKAGVGLQREESMAIVLETLLAIEPTQPELPTVTVIPELTDADVDAAYAVAQQMLSAPITMRHEDLSTTFTEAQLYQAFHSETVVTSEPTIVNSFDPAVISTFLEPVRSEFEAAPVNAEFAIEGETVRVIPGSKGTRIDEVETSQRLYDAAFTADRTGLLPIVEGADPEVTTEYLEGLNVRHLVAQFTTYHSCCEQRVTNIHKMADAIDGVLVLPGETFSLNDHVGERTIEKGYLPAPSIVAGEIEDTVGGGTSQFATTFYNAVFWGGYEDIDHKPHSYYFSRYPEGIEATLFWRSIDVEFRNNREHAILIDTRYTDTSITVRFFGFNHGRTLSGEQSGGRTRIFEVNVGGPQALHVKGIVSERYNITPPGSPKYRANPELDVDQQKRTQSPADGWSVTVTRTILIGGTQPFEEHQWVVRYSPQFEVLEVHPCKMPGATTACPTTTTTTTVPTTTTTIPEPP